jgi:broad specificity phosphatase PhoE
VRHAEKAATPSDDPPLNEAGLRRAEDLAHVLASTGVNAIYTSQYQRTRQTAEPTAKLLNLPITQLDGADPEACAARIRDEHRGETVLVVGHSNTIPAIISGLGAKVPTIPDSDYDNLYVVHLPADGPATVISLQYGQPNHP